MTMKIAIMGNGIRGGELVAALRKKLDDGNSHCISSSGSAQVAEDKPYYKCKHSLRCKACNKYWPDKCECKGQNRGEHA